MTSTIGDDKVRSLLCTAFEGGACGWCRIEAEILLAPITLGDFGEGGKLQVGPSYWHYSQLVPLTDGCALVIASPCEDDVDGDEGQLDLDDHDMYPALLDRKSIARGLQVLQDKYPHHYRDALTEDTDQTTGSIFLQCCLYGEVVYE